MASSEQFQRYNPINPLPDEIKSLPQDETVCKFCGVSYLIHNEIKRLETELSAIKLQLNGYETMKKGFDGLEAQNASLRAELEAFEERNAAQSATLSQLGDDLNAKNLKLDELKEQYGSLDERYNSQVMLIKQQEARLNHFHKTFQLYPSLRKQIQILNQQKEECKKEVRNLVELNSNNLKTLSDFTSVFSTKCNDTESELKDWIDEATALKSVATTLERDRDSAKAELQSVLQELGVQRDKVAVMERSSANLNHVQQQNVQLTQLVSQSQGELESIKTQLINSQQDNEMLRKTIKVKSEEHAELKKHMNDVTARHTAQIEDLNTKFQSSVDVQESLRNKMNSQMQNIEKDKEMGSQKTELLRSENSNLKKIIDQMSNEKDQVEAKSRSVLETHRIQLSDLHKSYQEQLNTTLNKVSVYKDHIDKLEREQKQHDSVLRDALCKSAQQHESQCRDIENQYKESQAQLEQQVDRLSQQYSKDLQAKERAVREIEKSFSLQLGDLKNQKDSVAAHVTHLNQQIATYERTIKELECRPAVQETSDESLKTRNSELEAEVLVLQRIVQKECEERLELSSKLDELTKCPPPVHKSQEVSRAPKNSSSAGSAKSILKGRPRVGNSNTLAPINRNSGPKPSGKRGAGAVNYAQWLEK